LVGVTYAALAQAVAKAEKQLRTGKEAARLFSAVQERLKLQA
jgi:hypothetical protein